MKGLDADVDVVVSAHTHQPYNCTIAGKLVTSAASFGRVLTRIEMTVDPALGKVTKKAAKNVVVTRDVTPDPDVQSVIATFQTRSAPLANRVVGHVTGDVTSSAMATASASCETPLGDLIADAQLAATSSPADGSALVAFMNPGGIRTDLVYAASGAEGDGAVTYAEAFAVQPFSNNLVTMTLTGAQIATLLEQQFAGAFPRVLQVSSGFSYACAFDAGQNKWKVTPGTITLLGAPVDPAKAYRVTVNAFLAGGGDGFTVLKQGTDRLTGVVDLDALVDYLGAHDPIAPPLLGRVAGSACPL